MITIYALMACWLAGVKPRVDINYLDLLNADVLDKPVDDRAWPLYLKAACELYVAKHGNEVGLAESTIDFQWEPQWDEMTDAEIESWLDTRRETIRLIRLATSKPTMGVQLKLGNQMFRDFDPIAGNLLADAKSEKEYRESAIYETLLGHVQQMRNYARVLYRDAEAAARRGDSRTAVDDLVAMLGVARHAGQGGNFLVAGLVRAAVESMAIETVRNIQVNHAGLFAVDELAELLHAFEAIEYPADRWLGGERIMFLDMVQRVYSDDGDGDGFLTAEGVRWLRELSSSLGGDPVQAIEEQIPGALGAAAPAFYLAAASRREVLAAYDRFLALAVADATRPLWQWEHRKGAASHFLDGLIFSTPARRLRYYPVWFLAPAVQAASQAFHRSVALRDGVLVGLALELYRRDQGHYPDALEELSPRWLPKVPVDPINGGPLGYRITGGKPVVYSLGIDTDDDGGRLPGYMNDAENESLGFSTTDRYRVGPPLTPEELTKPRPNGYIGHDGDWVLWSLAEPSYVPRGD